MEPPMLIIRLAAVAALALLGKRQQADRCLEMEEMVPHHQLAAHLSHMQAAVAAACSPVRELPELEVLAVEEMVALEQAQAELLVV